MYQRVGNVGDMVGVVGAAIIGGIELRGGGEDLAVRVELKHPVIGIGAPAHAFLPKAARLLNAEVIIPHDADVANAVGAITSHVRVTKTAWIRPDETGRFAVDGLPGAPRLATLDQAHRFATDELEKVVRQAARAAGTSESRVQIQVQDHVPCAADGTELFLERVVTACLVGRPDMPAAAAHDGE